MIFMYISSMGNKQLYLFDFRIYILKLHETWYNLDIDLMQEPENQRKSGLWAKKKAYLGKEKGIFGVLYLSVKKKKELNFHAF